MSFHLCNTSDIMEDFVQSSIDIQIVRFINMPKNENHFLIGFLISILPSNKGIISFRTLYMQVVMRNPITNPILYQIRHSYKKIVANQFIQIELHAIGICNDARVYIFKTDLTIHVIQYIQNQYTIYTPDMYRAISAKSMYSSVFTP